MPVGVKTLSLGIFVLDSEAVSVHSSMFQDRRVFLEELLAQAGITIVLKWSLGLGFGQEGQLMSSYLFFFFVVSVFYEETSEPSQSFGWFPLREKCIMGGRVLHSPLLCQLPFGTTGLHAFLTCSSYSC